MSEPRRFETKHVAALACVALLALIAWRMSGRTEPEPIDPPRVARRPVEAPPPPPRRRVSDTDEQDEYEALDDVQSPAEESIAPDAVLDPIRVLREEEDTYRGHARFPDYNTPLDPSRPDPIVDEHTPTVQREPGRRDGQSVLVVWPQKVAFVHPETPVIFAGILDADERPIVGTTITGAVHGEPPEMAMLGAIEFRDDGAAPDVSAGDGMFAGAVVLPPESLPALAANLMVRVRAVEPHPAPDDPPEHLGGTSFLVSVPAARLTGRYRDTVRDGSLVISAEVEVSRVGRIHVQGALYTMSDEPLAWAQNAGELQPGTTWMDLTYYGLLFHDRQAPGPYRLGSITLTTSTSMPGAMGDVLEDVHVTRAYTLDDFTSEEYGDPAMLHAAEQVEAERTAREAERAAP